MTLKKTRNLDEPSDWMRYDQALVARLEEKAQYHARQAERYRIAADTLRRESREVAKETT